MLTLLLCLISFSVAGRVSDIQDLPSELYDPITSNLDPKSVARLSMTNKLLNENLYIKTLNIRHISWHCSSILDFAAPFVASLSERHHVSNRCLDAINSGIEYVRSYIKRIKIKTTPSIIEPLRKFAQLDVELDELSLDALSMEPCSPEQFEMIVSSLMDIKVRKISMEYIDLNHNISRILQSHPTMTELHLETKYSLAESDRQVLVDSIILDIANNTRLEKFTLGTHSLQQLQHPILNPRLQHLSFTATPTEQTFGFFNLTGIQSLNLLLNCYSDKTVLLNNLNPQTELRSLKSLTLCRIPSFRLYWQDILNLKNQLEYFEILQDLPDHQFLFEFLGDNTVLKTLKIRRPSDELYQVLRSTRISTLQIAVRDSPVHLNTYLRESTHLQHLVLRISICPYGNKDPVTCQRSTLSQLTQKFFSELDISSSHLTDVTIRFHWCTRQALIDIFGQLKSQKPELRVNGFKIDDAIEDLRMSAVPDTITNDLQDDSRVFVV